jgi:hypothetical protein
MLLIDLFCMLTDFPEKRICLIRGEDISENAVAS